MEKDNLDIAAFKEACLDDRLMPSVTALKLADMEDVSRALAELHNSGSIDLISIFHALDWQSLEFYERSKWFRILEKSVPEISCEIANLVDLLRHVFQFSSKGYQHSILNAFEGWLVNNPKLVSESLLHFGDDELDGALIFSVLKTWKNLDISNALSAALDMSADPRSHIKRQAIRALGLFDLSENDASKQARLRLIELSKSENSSDQVEAVGAIISALDTSSKKPAELLKALKTVCIDPTSDVRHQLIAGQYFHPNAFSEKIRETVFGLMSTVSMDSPGTLDIIDSILYKLDPSSDKERILGVLTGLLTIDDGASTIDEFQSTTSRIFEAPQHIIGWYAVSLLLTGHPLLCSAVTDMFPPMDEGSYHFTLAEFALTEAEVFYLARKVFAYMMFSRGPATSVLAACLLALKSKSHKEMVETIGGYWIRNYPGDLDLFDVLGNQNLELKPSVTLLKRQWQAYQKPLFNLPDNPSFKPSTLERRVQAELSRHRHKEMYKQAQENSILATIVHKSTMLYGRAAVTYIKSGKSEAPLRQEMVLQSHEVSSPLPRMDVFYPARLNYLNYIFKKEKRPS